MDQVSCPSSRDSRDVEESETPPSYDHAVASDARQVVLTILANNQALAARDQAVTAQVSSRTAMRDICERYQHTSIGFSTVLGQVMQEFIRHRSMMRSISLHVRSRDPTGYSDAYRQVASIASRRSQEHWNRDEAGQLSALSIIAIVYDTLADHLEAQADQPVVDGTHPTSDQRQHNAINPNQFIDTRDVTSRFKGHCSSCNCDRVSTADRYESVRRARASLDAMMERDCWMIDLSCKRLGRYHPGYRQALMDVFERAVECGSECAPPDTFRSRTPLELPKHLQICRSMVNIARGLADEARRAEKAVQVRIYSPSSQIFERIVVDYEIEYRHSEDRDRFLRPEAY